MHLTVLTSDKLGQIIRGVDWVASHPPFEEAKKLKNGKICEYYSYIN